MKGEAFIPVHVIVRAHVFIARGAYEEGTGDQLKRFTAGLTPESALADVGETVRLVCLDERSIGRTRVTPIVDYRQGLAVEKVSSGHVSAQAKCCQSSWQLRPSPSEPEERQHE
jgi:hypothetical protein